MKNERIKNNRFCKVLIFLVVLAVGFSILGFAGYNPQIKASTQYYDANLQDYVINDWENYQSDSKNGISITNQGDGTLLVNGTASVITEFILPTTISSIDSTYYYDWYATILINNAFDYGYSNVRMYLGYNNGQNITTNSAYLGRVGSGADKQTQNRNNACLVLRFEQNASFTDTVFTPFFCLKYRDDGTTIAFSNSLSINMINGLLGPEQAASPDLTKVNYIQDASNISLVISTQVNKTFGNELESLIQYSFETGDTITVENAGITGSTIDLLTLSNGAINYKITFINDITSNDYLNIYLYKNNDATIFYNDNLGEISAQNIYDFRVWGADAITNGATITGGSALNNDIIDKMFVYSTGTNYETGYQAGFNDARADVEEELQEAWADGLEQGFSDGYTDGYGIGFDDGIISTVDTDWIVNLFSAVDGFFSIHLLPNITFGTIFAIPFVISIAWLIIRILRGGGYGD